MAKESFLLNIKILLLSLLFLSGCGLPKGEEETGSESFFLYVGQDTILPGEESVKMIPVVDRTISIPAALDLKEKAMIIADSLSHYYFNGLEIKIYDIDSLPDKGKKLTVDLVEPKEFDVPGSTPSYQSWYGYFQGSYGGQHTTLVLRESFNQPDYNGSWFNEVVFYYQGEPMPEMDHAFSGQ